MARKPLSKSVRFGIFRRDQFCCQYCGRTPPAVTLEVDHIIPVSSGGGDKADNLVTACFDCNRGKGAGSLNGVPQSLLAAAEETRERFDQMQALADMMKANRDTEDEWCFEVAEVLDPGCTSGFTRDNLNSIRMFIKRLGYPETMDSAEIAARKLGKGRQRFSYFCGVCWAKIREAAES